MSDKIKIKYDNGFSCIAYNDRQIANVLSKKHSSLSPLAVRIVNNMQLELGRNINDYIEVLKDSRIPISIYRFYEDRDISHYIMLRLGTGDVDDAEICYIICNKNKIMSIALNSKVLSSLNFRKYVGISLVMQTSLEGKDVEAYKEKLGTILGIRKDSIDIEVCDKNCSVFAYVKKGKAVIKYTFLKDNKKEFYRIASVSLDVTKI